MTEFAVHQEDDCIATRSVVSIAIVAVVVATVGVWFAGYLLTLTVGSWQPDVSGYAGRRGPERIISEVEQTPVRSAGRGTELREHQRRELETWGWADRKNGIAHIPIERAIDLVVAESAQ